MLHFSKPRRRLPMFRLGIIRYKCRNLSQVWPRHNPCCPHKVISCGLFMIPRGYGRTRCWPIKIQDSPLMSTISPGPTLTYLCGPTRLALYLHLRSGMGRDTGQTSLDKADPVGRVRLVLARGCVSRVAVSASAGAVDGAIVCDTGQRAISSDFVRLDGMAYLCHG
jgi:hypothetical protein